MIFQGHRWLCGGCHHRKWVDQGSFGAELTCVVCKTQTQAPIRIDWLFRPNEFLIECLRDRSTLSLVWVLHELAQRALFIALPLCSLVDAFFRFTRHLDAIVGVIFPDQVPTLCAPKIRRMQGELAQLLASRVPL